MLTPSVFSLPLYRAPHPRDLHSFPTRRSSDLLTVPGWELRPDGDGPFPAVVLLHGCHGVSTSTHAWARWFRDRRYVGWTRSEEHTSELQSPYDLVCRLLLEKKKKKYKIRSMIH